MKKIIFLILILVTLISGCTSESKSTLEKESKPSLNYNADISSIKSELIAKGYNVLKVDFNKNPNNYYVLQVVIDTKGNYDKETLEVHKIIHENGIADHYLVGISDYELQSVWSFTATKKTLDDFFSGKINEDEYIREVDAERIV